MSNLQKQMLPPPRPQWARTMQYVNQFKVFLNEVVEVNKIVFEKYVKFATQMLPPRWAGTPITVNNFSNN